MEDIIQLKDQFYVLATSSLADQRTRVLKHGEVFAVFDVYGNIQPIGLGAHGLYDGATRFLSHLELRLGNVRPLLLSSSLKNDNTLFTVDMMNRDAHEPSETEVQLLPGTLHVFRSKFLWNKACYERLRISNFGRTDVEIDVSFRFRSDFADIFEIRGVKRSKRGELMSPELLENGVLLSYRGLDGLVRKTRLEFAPKPQHIQGSEVHFRSRITPQEKATFFVTIACETEEPPAVSTYGAAFARVARNVKVDRARDCVIWTSNTQFNEWLQRSQADLHMMITKTPYGPYPYAGIPLFNTVFGRDGLITAFQSLWTNPEIARGVLAYLASTQAKETNDADDAEPGKILHEVRTGEMVALGEVPFRRYYGSVDSTPLFLVLAAAYFERTGDRAFIESIWPQLELALNWIDEFGDVDGDGFVEYQRRSPNGLVNQGWKDSFDSTFHEDGTLVEGPVALCEIQGYVYDAKMRMAELYSLFGHAARAEKLVSEASRLQEKFEEAFWCEDLSTYAIALDGKKRPCRVRSSNPGHCLLGGIVRKDRALRLSAQLLSEKMFSGWGIRTIGTSEARYNPMSYHNGSIWPHDNSLIAEGFARYGLNGQVRKLLDGLFDAALFIDLNRLPELFCGFVRRPGEGPTLYPVACAPQSWASASVFLLLKSVLGMSITGNPAQVRFHYPELPSCLDEVKIRDLRIGDATVDLHLARHGDDIGVNILRRNGPIEVVVVK